MVLKSHMFAEAELRRCMAKHGVEEWSKSDDQWQWWCIVLEKGTELLSKAVEDVHEALDNDQMDTREGVDKLRLMALDVLTCIASIH